MRISVFASEELQAVRAVAKELPREVASQLNKQTRAVAEPVWKRALAERVSTRLERRVIADTAVVSVTRANVTLKAGHKGRALKGGAKPSDIIAAVEFGANTDKTKTYDAVSRKGRSYKVRNRHTAAQLRERTSRGLVAYPAAAEVIPRLASLWVQTAMRTVAESLEGK